MTRTAASPATRASFGASSFFAVPVLALMLAMGAETQATPTLDTRSTGMDISFSPAGSSASNPGSTAASLEARTSGMDLSFSPSDTVEAQSAAPATQSAALETATSGMDVWFTASDFAPASTAHLQIAQVSQESLDLQSSGADVWFAFTYAALPTPAPVQYLAAATPELSPLSSGMDLWLTPTLTPTAPAVQTLAQARSEHTLPAPDPIWATY